MSTTTFLTAEPASTRRLFSWRSVSELLQTRLKSLPTLDVLDRYAGPVVFFLSAIVLTLFAGVIHRLGHGALSDFEAHVLVAGVALTWPLFVLEGAVRLTLCRRPGMSLGRRLTAFAAICAFPPLRLGGAAYADPGKIWLPGLGWSHIDHHLRCRLDRFFSVPMVVVALLVLPFLAMEHYWRDEVRASFALSLILDIGTSVIWLAFALELIVMVAVADDRFDYCLRHWIDLAIVFLPLLDFMPLLRLFGLAGLLELPQLARVGRLYRLRGLVSRTWRALLVLEMLERLGGRYMERRLERLKKALATREEEIAELRREITDLERAAALPPQPVG